MTVPRLLVATAVDAEREAVLAGLPPDTSRVTVAAVGVGPAAAAAGAARLLALAEAAGTPYHRVVCAGIGGGFAGRVKVGGVVLATRSVAADLGAASPEGFLALEELGFGVSTYPSDPALFAALFAELSKALADAVTGAVLTVSTVTGTSSSAAQLAARYPDAVAEGMEGYGVACAAALSGLGFAELRTVSNVIGPRERTAWSVPAALAALSAAGSALATTA